MRGVKMREMKMRGVKRGVGDEILAHMVGYGYAF